MKTDNPASADHIPKILDARGHAIMDYVTAGTFLALGVALRRRHTAASTLAFVHGASVLLASMLTDYPGGLWKALDFRTHRTLDMMQVSLMGAGPSLLGFAADPEARLFRGQAVLESGVVSATDWESA
jgi:hypothetical protein